MRSAEYAVARRVCPSVCHTPVLCFLRPRFLATADRGGTDNYPPVSFDASKPVETSDADTDNTKPRLVPAVLCGTMYKTYTSQKNVWEN